MELLKKIKYSLYFNVFLHALEMAALFCCLVFPSNFIFFVVMSSILTFLLIVKIEGLYEIRHSIWKSLFSKRLTVDNPASHRLFSIVENTLLMSLLYFIYCPYAFGISTGAILWLQYGLILATLTLYTVRPAYDYAKNDVTTRLKRLILFSVCFAVVAVVFFCVLLDPLIFYVVIAGIFVVAIYSVYFYQETVGLFINKLSDEPEPNVDQYPKINAYMRATSVLDLNCFEDGLSPYSVGPRNLNDFIEKSLQISEDDKSDLLGPEPINAV